MMETFWQDIRFGARTLLRSPGITALAIIALALGIGGNSAIFSVVNAVLLRPLPFTEPEWIMAVWATAPDRGLNQTGLSFQRFSAVAEQNKVFESVGAYVGDSRTMTGRGDPIQLNTLRVSAGFLNVLKVNLAMGRNFTGEEDKRGGQTVAILSHTAWERYFSSDPGVVGKTVTLDGLTFNIVGVMPAGFDFQGFQVDLWEPRVFEPTFLGSDAVERGSGYMNVIARLKPGVTAQTAQSELTTIAAQNVFAGHPDEHYTLGSQLLAEQAVSNIRTTLLIMLGAVAFVLLIACANVANLLLAKAVGRQKEITVRAALGASRGRLIRQFLTESILLAFIASVLGVLLSTWGLHFLISAAGGSLPRASEIKVDGRVLWFTILVGVLTGVIFGLAPALQASKSDLNESLKDNSRGATGGLRRNRLRSILVISEVALSVVLLIGAGLLIRSFVRLQNVNPGFNPANLLIVNLSLPASKYSTPVSQRMFYRGLEEKIEHLPGVVSAGTVQSLPLFGGARTPIAIEGRPLLPLPERDLSAFNQVSRDYFKTMGIPLLKGRYFDDRDTETSPIVLIIDQAFKDRFFPNEDPIGKRVLVGGGPAPREIVGLVGDVHQYGLNATSPYSFYICANQRGTGNLSVVVRTVGPPLSLSNTVRSSVLEIDKDQPVASFQAMDAALAGSISGQRFTLQLIGIFAAVALILASVGIYSVMAYAVSQRTSEIGLRMALGAQPRDVLKLVVGQGLVMVLIGMGIGLVAAFGLTRLMSSQLFNVSATDPVTFIFIPILLTVVALLACFVPARRATKVDPLVALRYD